jgi:hypothetical protein
VSWALAAVVYRLWEEPARRAVLRRVTPRRVPVTAEVSASGGPLPATPRR